jgi:hypothetical protein
VAPRAKSSCVKEKVEPATIFSGPVVVAYLSSNVSDGFREKFADKKGLIPEY